MRKKIQEKGEKKQLNARNKKAKDSAKVRREKKSKEISNYFMLTVSRVDLDHRLNEI
jgi:hypothetical protein